MREVNSRYPRYPTRATQATKERSGVISTAALGYAASANAGWSADVPIVHHHDVPRETFRAGMTYQTLVGDERGSTPVRVGIQTSAPGSRTPMHSHPYLEVLTILEGQGEAWIEGGEDLISISPGITLVLPADQKHWFRATGDKPLITYGVHASPHRIVDVHEG